MIFSKGVNYIWRYQTQPYMLHIVESHGFVKTGEVKTKAALEVWGGYTLVEKPL